MTPITDEEVQTIASTLVGKTRPSWPQEIREIVGLFQELRRDPEDWLDGE